MAVIRIGTCSWKYESWRGLVYSNAQKINYLKEFSEKYSTVEIDQWFWSLHDSDKVTMPKREVVEAYSASVPSDFKFGIKIPNSVTLTHFYSKSKTEPLRENPYFFSNELFNDFLKTIDPMKKLLGPLMFQFEYLNKKKMKSQFEFQIHAAGFIQKLPKNFFYAVEIRNPNYLNENYFNFLEENNLTHVFLEGYYMPPITEVFKKYRNLIKDRVVIRLHGPDRKGMEEKSGGIWNKILEPKNSDLSKIADMLDELLSREVDIYLYVNNHYEGSAPLTIEKIKKMIK